MRVVPIIEIQNGNTFYGLPERGGMSARIKNPVLHIRHWIDQGAQTLFIKDIDGCTIGKPQYTKFLEYIDDINSEQVYYCGGIRDLRSIRIFEHRPYTKIVSATSVIENKKFLRNIIANKIGPIALWIDSVDGFVYTRNASHNIGKRTIDFLRSLPELGIDEIFFCARNENGVLRHPDFDMLENLLDLELPPLYLADNATTRDDIKKLGQYHELAGIALKDPLYDGTISIAEAQRFFHEEKIVL